MRKPKGEQPENMRERVGRPPSIRTPEQLRNWTKIYCDACEEKGIFPDYDGMLLWLCLEDEDIAQFQDPNNPDYEEFKKALAYGMRRRKSYLARTMTSDNKRAVGCFNALKQAENGGYSDKADKDRERTLNVNVIGVGGVEAFK